MRCHNCIGVSWLEIVQPHLLTVVAYAICQTFKHSYMHAIIMYRKVQLRCWLTLFISLLISIFICLAECSWQCHNGLKLIVHISLQSICWRLKKRHFLRRTCWTGLIYYYLLNKIRKTTNSHNEIMIGIQIFAIYTHVKRSLFPSTSRYTTAATAATTQIKQTLI